ncbi:cation efflux family protein [Lojkania enalia]|uniref:Cation efflux family protein n=1 Tax=Lojkania enalia TaxID=147567 RepID=A0A9P4K9Y4_9PLEO|nr:cation efflux family protein [Didymosphaeria enalia]
MHFQITRKTRLRAVIAISFVFFLTEISAGFYTRSLALVADAFHYLNDLIGFIVALVAVQVTERGKSPQDLSFGWARAQLLGAFFNGVFLLALGLSICLQSIERFVRLEHIENPKIVLVVGCVGLFLNIISATFLHGNLRCVFPVTLSDQTTEHDHGDGHGDGHSHSHSHSHDHSSYANHPHSHEEAGSPIVGTEMQNVQPHPDHAEHIHLLNQSKKHGMDLGILGVLIHVIGDAINNIGVIISALVIWLTKPGGRFYIDPAVSMWIGIMILISAIPLTKRSGTILLQSAPPGVKLDDVKHDLELVPGVQSVHELHVWRLDQKKVIASAHVVVKEESLSTFMKAAQTVSECLHAYGIHSATLQPELLLGNNSTATRATTTSRASSIAGSLRQRAGECGLTCGKLCEPLMCCN